MAIDDSGARRPGTSREIAKQDFARRLKRLMHTAGWNQSDVWRHSEAHTPKGAAGITRDLVSKYVNAKSLPGQLNLTILADTFGCREDELLPGGIPEVAENELGPALDVRENGDGSAWVRINQAIEWPKALRILAILRGDDEGAR